MVKNLSAVRENQIQSLGREDPLEKGMATHSSILGWRIPWTEEPGGLQSMGSQRVGHNWVHTYSQRRKEGKRHLESVGNTRVLDRVSLDQDGVILNRVPVRKVKDLSIGGTQGARQLPSLSLLPGIWWTPGQQSQTPAKTPVETETGGAGQSSAFPPPSRSAVGPLICMLWQHWGESLPGEQFSG